MTGSRQIGGHATVPQRLSSAVGPGVREFLIGRELLLQRTFDRHIIGIP